MIARNDSDPTVPSRPSANGIDPKSNPASISSDGTARSRVPIISQVIAITRIVVVPRVKTAAGEAVRAIRVANEDPMPTAVPASRMTTRSYGRDLSNAIPNREKMTTSDDQYTVSHTTWLAGIEWAVASLISSPRPRSQPPD